MKILSKFVMGAMAILASPIFANANDVQMATLQHNGETQVFYEGTNSLISALAKAVSGDIITLSPGTFASTGIRNAVTIIGAGAWAQEPANGRYITKIKGELEVTIAENDENHLSLEGLRLENFQLKDCTLKNATFSRIVVENSMSFSGGETVNCAISQCEVVNALYPDKNCKNFYVTNSIIGTFGNSDNSCSLFLHNSYFGTISSASVFTAYNCIFRYFNSPSSAACVYTNCIFKLSHSPNRDATTTNCWTLGETDWNAIWSDGTHSHLTPEAAAVYKGTDGTEVGIFGGEKGWKIEPAIPSIYATEIDKQPTADGKLNVKFSVKAQQ